LLGALLFWLYGCHYGAAIFRAVLAAHAARFNGFDAFFELLFVPKVVDDPMPCLLLVLGLGVLIGEIERDSAFEWLLLVGVYAGLIGFFADKTMVRGWYLMPIMPALFVGLARQIIRMWDETGARNKWLWCAFMAPDLARRLLIEHSTRLTLLRYAYFGAVIAAVGMLVCVPRASRRCGRIVTIVIVGVQLVSDLAVILGR
jgi:hypothetical protein